MNQPGEREVRLFHFGVVFGHILLGMVMYGVLSLFRYEAVFCLLLSGVYVLLTIATWEYAFQQLFFVHQPQTVEEIRPAWRRHMLYTDIFTIVMELVVVFVGLYRTGYLNKFEIVSFLLLMMAERSGARLAVKTWWKQLNGLTDPEEEDTSQTEAGDEE